MKYIFFRVFIAIHFSFLAAFASAQTVAEPTDEQQSLINAMTMNYLMLEQEGKYEAQYAMFNESFALSMSFDQFKQLRSEVAEALGHSGQGRPVAVTWYPKEKLYAAVDLFTISETRNAVSCGYIVWKFETDSIFGIARIETNIVDLDMLAAADAAQRPQLLSEYTCNPQVKDAILSLFN